MGSAVAGAIISKFGLQDLGKKDLDLDGENDEGFWDMLVWETSSIVSLDDLIVRNDCNDTAPAFQAMGVPPLPKNRNASCGKHKDEIFSQLHEMAKKDPNYSGSLEDFEAQVDVQPQVPANYTRDVSPGLENNVKPVKLPSYEAVQAMVQQAMQYIDKTPDLDSKIELIKTLNNISAGKMEDKEVEVGET